MSLPVEADLPWNAAIDPVRQQDGRVQSIGRKCKRPQFESQQSNARGGVEQLVDMLVARWYYEADGGRCMHVGGRRTSMVLLRVRPYCMRTAGFGTAAYVAKVCAEGRD